MRHKLAIIHVFGILSHIKASKSSGIKYYIFLFIKCNVLKRFPMIFCYDVYCWRIVLYTYITIYNLISSKNLSLNQ